MPLAIVLVLLAGIGPVISWRRATPANLRRLFLAPLVDHRRARRCCSRRSPRRRRARRRSMMFTLIGFVLAVVAQEFWRGTRARRVMAGEPWPLALFQLVARNRRRYGGYVVHAGIALVFLGVAASVGVRAPADIRLPLGQTTNVGGYTVRYVRPTATVLDDSRAHGRAGHARRGARHAPRRSSTGTSSPPPTTTRRPTARAGRSAATSRATPPASSTPTGASRATSGRRSSRTQHAPSGRSRSPTRSSRTPGRTSRRW